jgi:hypothetical protein
MMILQSRGSQVRLRTRDPKTATRCAVLLMLLARADEVTRRGTEMSSRSDPETRIGEPPFGRWSEDDFDVLAGGLVGRIMPTLLRYLLYVTALEHADPEHIRGDRALR